MNIITARNVHRALPIACLQLHDVGLEDQSRNGPVLRVDGPVSTIYERPQERVVFWPERDANPFFHFAESLWMLAGQEDVAFVARFSKQIARYSDDGERFHAAYGARWRRGMPADLRERTAAVHDQLVRIAQALRDDPTCRRQVLQIWDGRSDLGTQSKDLPCNLTATFQVSHGAVGAVLDMVVFNRSNDVVWGCYGANAVHFSYLHEYVAARARLPMGRYWQISVNWHGYRNVFDALYERFAAHPEDVCDLPCPYERGEVAPFPLMQPETDPDEWDRTLRALMRSGGRAPSAGHWATDPFFEHVALPILRAYDAYKDSPDRGQGFISAMAALDACRATDWRRACQEWIERRRTSWLAQVSEGEA